MTTWNANVDSYSVYNALHEIPARTRTLPPLIMLIAASKAFIGFIISIFVFVGVMIAGWKIVEKNQYADKLSSQHFVGLANSNPAFDYSRQTLTGANRTDDDQQHL